VATAEQQAKPKAKDSAKDEEQKPPRPIGEIQQDIASTRERLVNNLEQLKAETSPKALGEKASTTAKSVVMNEDGSVRVERVAMIAGAVVGLLLIRKGFKTRAKRKQLEALAKVVWVPVPREAVNPELAARARNAKELAPLTEDYAPQLALASA
jgi:hypothetical protein